eukprot:TRINITY_DN35404_c0_g1_i1.p1 TRINITY_DN35404_c0_g1~~TRINITY_DN35404_c0_g1_i1.p1  ORF type:complete len:1441 (+),score=513.81 TRINITY_DN35404_c0_g1_i1:59-4381(+)
MPSPVMARDKRRSPPRYPSSLLRSHTATDRHAGLGVGLSAWPSPGAALTSPPPLPPSPPGAGRRVSPTRLPRASDPSRLLDMQYSPRAAALLDGKLQCKEIIAASERAAAERHSRERWEREARRLAEELLHTRQRASSHRRDEPAVVRSGSDLGLNPTPPRSPPAGSTASAVIKLDAAESERRRRDRARRRKETESLFDVIRTGVCDLTRTDSLARAAAAEHLNRDLRRLDRRLGHLVEENSRLQARADRESRRADEVSAQLSVAKAAQQMQESRINELDALNRRGELLVQERDEEVRALRAKEEQLKVRQAESAGAAVRETERLAADLAGEQQRSLAERLQSQSLQDQVSQLLEDMDECRRRAELAEQSVRETREELATERRRSAAAEAAVAARGEEMIGVRAEAAGVRDAAVSLERMLAETKQELESTKARAEEGHRLHAAASRAKEQLQIELSKAQTEVRLGEDRKRELEQLRAQHERAVRLHEQLAHEAAALRGSVEASGAAARLQEGAVATAESERDRYIREVAELRESRDLELARLRGESDARAREVDRLEQEKVMSRRRMEELQDKIGGLGPRAAALEQERNEARTLAQSKSLELQQWISDNRSLEVKLQEATKDLDQMRHAAAETKNRLEQDLSREKAVLHSRVRELEHEVTRKTESAVTDSTQAMAILKMDIELARKEAAQLRNQLDQSCREHEGERRDAAVAKQRCEQAELETERLRREMERQVTAVQREVDAREAKVDAEKRRVVEQAQATEAMVGERDKVRAELRACQGDLQTAREQNVRFEEQVRMMTQQAQDREAALAASRTEAMGLESHVKRLEEERRELSTELSRQRARADEFASATEQQTASLAVQTRKNDKLCAQSRDATAELERLVTRSELQQKQYSDDVQRLQQQIQMLEDRSIQDRRATEHLEVQMREEQQQRALVIAARREDHETVIKPNEQKLRTLRGERKTLKDELVKHRERIEQLKEAVAASHQLLEEQRAAAELKEQELQAETAATVRRADELHRELTAARDELRSTRQQAQESACNAFDTKLTLSAKIQALEERNQHLAGDNEQLAGCVNQLEDKSSRLADLVEEKKAEAAERGRRALDLEAALAESQRKCEAAETQLRQSEDSRRRNEIDLASGARDRAELQQCKQDLQHATERAAALEASHGDLAQRVVETEGDLRRLQADAARASDELKLAQQELGHAEADRVSLRRQHDDRTQEVRELKSAVVEMRCVNEQYKREAALVQRDRDERAEVWQEERESAEGELRRSRADVTRMSEEVRASEHARAQLERRLSQLSLSLDDERARIEQTSVREREQHQRELARVAADSEAARRASEDQSTRAQAQLRGFLATVLKKQHDLINMHRDPLPPTLDSAQLSALDVIPMRVAAWRDGGAATSWDAEAAQELFTKTMSVLMHLLNRRARPGDASSAQ